jgi:hypothetical protein
MATENTTPRPNSRLRPRNRAKRCFELAGRFQLDDPTWTLVHGIVCAENGTHLIRYAHGWLKRDQWVYDAVRDESFVADEYVTRFGAEEVGTYNSVAAAKAASTVGHWGPWVEYDSSVIVGGR